MQTRFPQIDVGMDHYMQTNKDVWLIDDIIFGFQALNFKLKHQRRPVYQLDCFWLWVLENPTRKRSFIIFLIRSPGLGVPELWVAQQPEGPSFCPCTCWGYFSRIVMVLFWKLPSSLWEDRGYNDNHNILVLKEIRGRVLTLRWKMIPIFPPYVHQRGNIFLRIPPLSSLAGSGSYDPSQTAVDFLALSLSDGTWEGRKAWEWRQRGQPTGSGWFPSRAMLRFMDIFGNVVMTFIKDIYFKRGGY